MSDNPADSLRRELEAAVLKSLIRHMLSPYEATAASVASDLWPLVEAARADERERTKAECVKAVEMRWSPGTHDSREAVRVITEWVGVSDGN